MAESIPIMYVVGNRMPPFRASGLKKVAKVSRCIPKESKGQTLSKRCYMVTVRLLLSMGVRYTAV